VVVANQVSDAVTAFLLANRDAAGFMSLAVKIPEPLLDRPGTFADLTALVGGRAFLVAAGDTLSSVKPHDLGNAAFAWADKDYLGLVEGMGDEDARAQHIEALQSAFDRSTEVDQRIRLLERLGKFVGGSAILWTGGATDSEIAFRKQMVEATVPAMRAALREGVVPGGGAALLACKPVLRNRQAQSSNADERVAYNILLKAMDVPLRTIVANAGHDPAEVMAAISCKDGLRCFDVLGGKVVDVLKAGILDVAAAYKAAVQSAVSTAALTLTIDVLVHSRKPEQVIDPG
jgi:chaperonin GroEL